MLNSGICGTDLHIFRGSNQELVTPGTVLGHEFAGMITAKGSDVTHLKIGERIAVEPNLYCGTCYYCITQRKHFCENWAAIGLSRDGGFQEYCTIPAYAAYIIPKNVDFETAAFFEPLACVIHGIKRSDLGIGGSVLVQGVGTIGQLFIKVLKKWE